jgi:DNA repair exonuclease SbcCD ATPase subunit
VSHDIDHVLMHPVPPMRADARHQKDDARGAIEALADRVDTLASMVRETSGSLSASRGEVASLDRRVQDRIAADTQRSEAELSALRRELDAVRTFVAEHAGTTGAVAAAASNPLNETVATLTERVETLGGIIRSTAGSLAAEQSRLSILSEALAKGDERVEARLAAMQHELRVVSENAAARPAAPAPVDTEQLEQRVDQKVGELVQRVDFLAGTVGATAGKLAAREGDLAKVEELISRQEAFRGSEIVQQLSADLAALKERVAVDPELEQQVGGLVKTVQTLDERVATLAAVVLQTEGRRGGHEPEIEALDRRLEEVGTRIDDVALQIRLELEAIAKAPADGSPPADVEQRFTAFGEQLARLGTVVEDASGAAEQVRTELRVEIAALAEAVQRERIDLDLATSEWEARRSALEERMDELAIFATDTTRRGVDEMAEALHLFSRRLEELEQDRKAVESDATNAEKAWEREHQELEARLDALATSVAEGRLQAPGTSAVAELIDEFAGRLARMEGERETVAELAAQAETWTAELATLEARIDEGLSTLEEHDTDPVESEGTHVLVDGGLSESLAELTQRIEHVERDGDSVREELMRTASSWADERASLQERVSELAARIVTGPMPAATDATGEPSEDASKELDRLRIAMEGMRMRLAYHEKTVAELSGTRTVMQHISELSARVDQLAAAIAAGAPTSAGAAAAPALHAIGAETSGLMSQIEEAERLRIEMRDRMLDRMEKIASQMNWRIQRLETAGTKEVSGVS